MLWILGYPDQALALGQESLLLARDPVRPFDVADIWGEVMELQLLCGEIHPVMHEVEKMLTLVRKYDFTQPMT